MGRLILHIGTHKTATTTLQRHLARNRETLADAWHLVSRLRPDREARALCPPRHRQRLLRPARQADTWPMPSASSARCWPASATMTPPSSAPSPSTATSPTRGATRSRPRPRLLAAARALYRAGPRRSLASTPAGDRGGVPPPGRLRPVALPGAGQGHPLPQELRHLPPRVLVPFRLSGQARVWAQHFAGSRRCASRISSPRRPDRPPCRASRPRPQRTAPGEQQNVSLLPDVVVVKRMLNATKIDKDVLRADIEAGAGRTARPPGCGSSTTAPSMPSADDLQGFSPPLRSATTNI